MSKPKLKRSDLILDPNNPFGDDATKSREELANALSGLIEDTEEPLVVALNGGWGTGKTYFLGRWAASLEKRAKSGKQKPYVINFSAWQDDDLEDPLLAVVGQIHHFLHAKQVEGFLTPDIKTRLNEFCKAANTILSKCSCIASKFIEHHTGINPAETVEAFGNYQAQRVETYSDSIHARADMKNRLINLAEYVWGETEYPLVIIIDDLDRCRPTFAIALLERIKHLFDVRHVTFVLGIDQEQFIKALHNIYGSQFDAANYLHRLIDIEFKLPHISPNDFIDLLLMQYSIKQYLAENEASDTYVGVLDEFRSVLLYLAKRFTLSFREIERLVREIVLIERIHPTFSQVESTLIAILVCLRNHDRKLFDSFVNDTVSPKEVIDRMLRQPNDSRKFGNVPEVHIATVIFASSKNSVFNSAITDLSASISDVSKRRSSVPNIYMNNTRAMGTIAEQASSIGITHESVVNIVNALQHFKNWVNPVW